MTRRPRPGVAALAAALLALVLVSAVGTGPAAAAPAVPAAPVQDGGEVPTQDIIPRPNSGKEPEEAGDRGGALQLAIFGLVLVAIFGGGAHVALQSRRSRYSATSDRIASQADTPSRNPER